MVFGFRAIGPGLGAMESYSAPESSEMREKGCSATMMLVKQGGVFSRGKPADARGGQTCPTLEERDGGQSTKVWPNSHRQVELFPD